MASPLTQADVDRLLIGDFCRIFGAVTNEFSRECVRKIESKDFRYTVLRGRDYERALIAAVDTIASGALTISGPGKKPQWEKGWSENLSEFVESGDFASLMPKYVKRNRAMRLEGQYILPESPVFEESFLSVLHTYIFERYFADASEIFEFGSGTGVNLVEMADIFPHKVLHGLDWVLSSKQILDRLSPRFGGRIRGHVFDMFEPKEDLEFPPGAAVFTAGALEQLGPRFDAFLTFILRRRPMMCVHLEPIFELYDERTLMDYVAARFTVARNWLRGFLPRLRELEAQGLIEIVKVKRTLGSFYHDGYSILVWRPLDR